MEEVYTALTLNVNGPLMNSAKISPPRNSAGKEKAVPELSQDEYFRRLAEMELEACDPDLRAIHVDRQWQRSFSERCVAVQNLRLLRRLVELMEQAEKGRYG